MKVPSVSERRIHIDVSTNPSAPRPPRLALLPGLALLALVLVMLPGLVMAQQTPAAPAQGSMDAQPAIAPMLTPSPTPTLIGNSVPCDPTPVPGSGEPTPVPFPESAKVLPGIREEEIAAVWRPSSSQTLYRNGFNYTGSTALTALSSASQSFTPNWFVATAVDFNGDRYDEMFVAYKDENKILSARSYVGRPPTGSSATVTAWNAGSGATQGDRVEWIDVTAGNFEARSDRKQMVVMAYANANEDFEMLGLTGDANGNIAQPSGSYARLWRDSTGNRGNVHHVHITHGDLNGDGWDQEIVAAFQDSGNDLAILVTRLSYSPYFYSVASINFSDSSTSDWAHDICPNGDDDRSARTCLDVTTGDVDGDGIDEVIVAFQDREDYLQVRVLRLVNNNELTAMSDGENYYFRNDPDTRDVDFVSVAAPDLEGDGVDEVVVAFGGRVNYRPTLSDQGPAPVQLWTLRTTCATASTCKIDRDANGVYKDNNDYGSSYTAPQNVNVAKANVDLTTAEEEVALALFGANEGGNNDKVVVKLFRQNSTTKALAEISDSVITANGDNNGVALVVGDFDANSVQLKYTGECKRYGLTTLSAVVNLPPMWGGFHVGDVTAAYGMSTSGGTSQGQSLSGSVGATIELDGSASVLDAIEVGPVLTTEFEYTHAVSKEESSSAQTTTQFDAEYNATNNYTTSAFGFALSEEVQYQVYKYIDESGQRASPFYLRVPKQRGTTSKTLEAWNADWWLSGWQSLGYRNNLAKGKTATQSSTFGSASASLAVDGNTDGNYYNGSVSHTNSEAGAWWQVDLGSMKSIGSVDIWNRNDGGATVQGRLKNYRVKVYDTDPATGASPTWQSDKFTLAVGFPTPVRVARRGQWVRIQFESDYTAYLHLAEVQVWETREASSFPKSLTRNSDTQFTITNQDNSTTTVQGNLKWDWCTDYLDPDTGIPQSSVTGQPEVKTCASCSNQTWDFGTAFSGSKTQTDGFSINQSLVFEAKAGGVGVAAGATWGFDGQWSRSVNWDASTYFEGKATNLIDAADDEGKYGYLYCPYMYTVTKTTADGSDQAYVVLDYYVPCIETASSYCTPTAPPNAMRVSAVRPAGTLAVKPLAPVIATSTHPDPNAWSTETTATFTWQQPAGDPAQIVGYRYYLDKTADTILDDRMQGLEQEYTYRNLEDGTWYMHVRAKGADEWSDTAHRRIRIDRLAPEVTLTVDPPVPQGNQGWYTSPVTVTAAATDEGSGVASLEISTDGTTWQPYAGPLHYTTDAPPTTIWARASDVAGHASDPVMTAFKIDLAAPDSHAVGEGCIWGVCYANIDKDAQGNEHLVLAGQIHEATSGRAGMQIQANGGSWTPASALGDWHPFPDRPTVAINWVYTATLEIGHGYHIFNGRAADNAGHLEEPYKIAEFIWYPLASPDLSQSSIVMDPAVAKPGDTVMVTVNVRNGGRQESHVSIKATLPAGLKPAEGALASVDGTTVYDPVTGVITWPEILLWQGQDWRFTFPAVVAAGTPAGTLSAKLDLHGFWPNSDLLPPVMRQQFLDKEVTAAVTASLAVEPALPANRDVTAPHVRLAIAGGEVPDSDTVQLVLQADADARWMYVREWTLDPVSGAWIVARDSGWLGYAPSLNWDLSAGAGVKYIGAWVADAAGNVSRLDEASLAFTNRLIDDKLLAGQRRQYRFTLGQGLAAFNLLAHSGQADLYAWMPKLSQYPSYVGVGSISLKAVGFQIQVEGVHLVEAAAAQEASYTLLPAAGPAPAAASSLDQQAAALPNHPLSVSTPLTGGAGAAPTLELKPLYLPLITR